MRLGLMHTISSFGIHSLVRFPISQAVFRFLGNAAISRQAIYPSLGNGVLDRVPPLIIPFWMRLGLMHTKSSLGTYSLVRFPISQAVFRFLGNAAISRQAIYPSLGNGVLDRVPPLIIPSWMRLGLMHTKSSFGIHSLVRFPISQAVFRFLGNAAISRQAIYPSLGNGVLDRVPPLIIPFWMRLGLMHTKSSLGTYSLVRFPISQAVFRFLGNAAISRQAIYPSLGNGVLDRVPPLIIPSWMRLGLMHTKSSFGIHSLVRFPISQAVFRFLGNAAISRQAIYPSLGNGVLDRVPPLIIPFWMRLGVLHTKSSFGIHSLVRFPISQAVFRFLGNAAISRQAIYPSLGNGVLDRVPPLIIPFWMRLGLMHTKSSFGIHSLVRFPISQAVFRFLGNAAISRQAIYPSLGNGVLDRVPPLIIPFWMRLGLMHTKSSFGIHSLVRFLISQAVFQFLGNAAISRQAIYPSLGNGVLDRVPPLIIPFWMRLGLMHTKSSFGIHSLVRFLISQAVFQFLGNAAISRQAIYPSLGNGVLDRVPPLIIPFWMRLGLMHTKSSFGIHSLVRFLISQAVFQFLGNAAISRQAIYPSLGNGVLDRVPPLIIPFWMRLGLMHTKSSFGIHSLVRFLISQAVFQFLGNAAISRQAIYPSLGNGVLDRVPPLIIPSWMRLGLMHTKSSFGIHSLVRFPISQAVFRFLGNAAISRQAIYPSLGNGVLDRVPPLIIPFWMRLGLMHTKSSFGIHSLVRFPISQAVFQFLGNAAISRQAIYPSLGNGVLDRVPPLIIPFWMRLG